jgi:acyl-CoA thioester hydrolase
MEAFITPIEVRWSDLDPNVHVRHSVYYDWGALSRIRFLNQNGLSTSTMQQLQIGPIIFREECVFKREVRLEDVITIDVEVMKARRDFSRWTIRHNIVKDGNTVAAILTLDGAWIDMAKRKLAVTPQEVINAFQVMPKAKEFEWAEKEKQ